MRHGLLAGLLVCATCVAQPVPLRPPAARLVTHDPYFSILSPADKLTDADTMHWTGKPHRLTGLVRIDGKGFRLMGKEPANVPAPTQAGLEVLPKRTINFQNGKGQLGSTYFGPPWNERATILPVEFAEDGRVQRSQGPRRAQGPGEHP